MEKFRCSRLFVFIVVAATFAVMSTAAGADAKDFKNYGRLCLGANVPTEDLDDAGYDTGFNASVAYGRYLTKYLVVEGGVNFFFSDEEFYGSTPTAGLYDRDDYLSVSVLMATIKGELPLGPVKLYAGGGVGAYYAYLSADIDTQYLGDFDVHDDDTVFGAHVVVGGSYDITSRIFVGFEGLYRWTDDIDIYERVGTVPVSYEGNLDGYAITVTGGFRF